MFVLSLLCLLFGPFSYLMYMFYWCAWRISCSFCSAGLFLSIMSLSWKRKEWHWKAKQRLRFPPVPLFHFLPLTNVSTVSAICRHTVSHSPSYPTINPSSHLFVSMGAHDKCLDLVLGKRTLPRTDHLSNICNIHTHTHTHQFHSCHMGKLSSFSSAVKIG